MSYTDTVRPIEERAEIEALAILQGERRTLVDQNAKLIALYGAFGHYDDHRKRMVEALKVRARMELSAASEKKPTESQIDSEAYASPQYERFIDNALSEKIEYLKAANRIAEIDEQVRSREEELRVYGKELQLAR